MKTFTFFIAMSIVCSWTTNAQQDFWKQTNGPPGIGHVAHGGVGMNASGHLFAADLEGFAYRSMDHGLNWKEFSIGVQTHCIAVSPKGYIFAGTWGSGVYRSTDDGETWQKTNCPNIYAVRMIADSAGGIIVGTFHDRAGLLRSTDEGDTWTYIGPGNYEITGLSVNRFGYIFVMGDNVLYRSTDNGTTWYNTGLNHSVYGIAFTSNNDVYVLGAWEWGLWVSTDNGVTWDTIQTLPHLPSGACFVDLRIDSEDNLFITGGQGYSDTIPGTYRSNDLGVTWTKIWNLDSDDFLFDSEAHTIMFACRTGIFHSTDKGDHWQLTGSRTGKVRAMTATPLGYLLAGNSYDWWGGAGNVYYSTDRGVEWSFAGLPRTEILSLCANSSGKFFSGTNNGMFSTADFGSSWITSGLPNAPVFCVERSPGGEIFAGTGGVGIYRSTDDGVSWSYVGLMNTNVKSLFTESPGDIFAGLENVGVYHSLDNGTSWSFVGLPNTTVTSLTGGAAGTIIAGTNNGVYRSTDDGNSWSYIDLSGKDIKDLISSYAGELYAATASDGIYFSTDNGGTWSDVNSGLNHQNVTSLAFDGEGYLCAGTDGGGVYRSKEVILTKDTIILSLYPNSAYQTHAVEIQIRGANTHFGIGSSKQVWLSKNLETVLADSVVVNSNTSLDAYFSIALTATTGLWSVNVEDSIDGILTKQDCFNIMAAPARIVVSPDSIGVTLHRNDSSYQQITFTNDGFDTLRAKMKVTKADGVALLDATKFEFKGTLNGHYYYLSKAQATWHEAKTACENAGGHLVTINNEEENNFVKIFNTWVGLTDEVTEGDWKWVTGESVNYTVWCGGQPDNLGNEDAAEYIGSECWNDAPISHIEYYVIEFDSYDSLIAAMASWLVVDTTEVVLAPLQSTSRNVKIMSTGLTGGTYKGEVAIVSNDPYRKTQVIPVELEVPAARIVVSPDRIGVTLQRNDSSCQQITFTNDGFDTLFAKMKVTKAGGVSFLDPAKYDYIGTLHGHGYFLSKNMVTWHQAKTECENVGGHLATVTTAEENDFLQNIANEEKWVWIGLTDELQEGVWQWVTGEPVTYQNWSPGQPDNGGCCSPIEHYAHYWPDAGNTYGWNDWTSVAQTYYFMEVDNYDSLMVAMASWLVVDTTEIVLAPSHSTSREVQIMSIGLRGGTYIGEITITSNDPYRQTQAIPVTLQVVTEIVISPGTLNVTVNEGSTTTGTFEIQNKSESDINYKIYGGFGSNNYALKFDGTDDMVFVEDSPSLNPVNAITLEAWVFTSELTTQDFISKDGENYDRQYLFTISYNPQYDYVFRSHIGVQSGFYYFDGTSLITSNTWYHTAMTYDGIDLKLYVNGLLDGCMKVNGTIISTTQPVRLGGGAPSGATPLYFKGIMSEVRIWNIARTQAEIQDGMHKELSCSESNLVGCWQFNEGVGSVAYDKTVNANNGTLFGGIEWTNSGAPIKPRWLSMNVDSGSCAAHSSVDVELAFDATELESGDYYASLIIKNSHPFDSTVLVPIHMIVTPTEGNYISITGWNLCSFPYSDEGKLRSEIYEHSTSDAFYFKAGYEPSDTLYHGKGYWVKCDYPDTQKTFSGHTSCDTIDVNVGWNIIGSICEPVAVSTIQSEPSGIVTSQFFGYNGNSYYETNTISPWKGYWVKVNQAGKLILSTASKAIASNRINIVASNEQPPPPPNSEIPNPKSQIPARFALEQNYPNPFNPVTNFQFSISPASGQDQLTILKVYDVLGREVATLVNEVKQPGEYTATWDAANVPSGIYFYRFTAGKFIETKKLILMK